MTDSGADSQQADEETNQTNCSQRSESPDWNFWKEMERQDTTKWLKVQQRLELLQEIRKEANERRERRGERKPHSRTYNDGEVDSSPRTARTHKTSLLNYKQS